VLSQAAPKSYEELADEYMQWIWLGVLVMSALVVGLAMNTFCCPAGGSIAVAAVLTTIIFLAGALTAAAGAYGYWVNNDLVAPFVGETTLIVVMGFGGLLSTIALWTFIGFCSKSRFVLTTVFIFYLLTLLIELAFAGLVAYWVYTLQAVTEDAMTLLEGGDAEDGKFSGRLGADVLAEVEGSMCRFYQECCRDPLLGEDGTCISSHEGSTVDVAEALLDPGSPNFCPYISGSSGVMSFVPSPAACLTAEHLIPGFSMASCETNFCSHGYEGYEEFLAQAVDWMMNNGIIIGGVSTAVVLLQLLLAVNVLRLAKSRMKTRLAMRKVVPESRGLDREPMPFNPPPQPQRRRAR